MTVQKIIAQVSTLLSDRIEESVLYTWFNEIELMIQMQLFGIARADAVQYTKENSDVAPIASGQYERVYSYWLLAKGHFRLHNQAGYNRFRKLYISEYAAFRKWVIRTHGTADMQQSGGGVYLSAYGIALKHGFVGTEQEWLASLHGRDGADGANGTNGKDGKDGIDGKDGLPGKDGADGKDGLPGKDGINGIDGKDGLPGKDGVDGKDGAQYDLQYDPDTHILQLLCNGEVVRSFDLTQSADVESLMGLMDCEEAYILDCEGAYILPLE